jgi:hypothetical protein
MSLNEILECCEEHMSEGEYLKACLVLKDVSLKEMIGDIFLFRSKIEIKLGVLNERIERFYIFGYLKDKNIYLISEDDEYEKALKNNSIEKIYFGILELYLKNFITKVIPNVVEFRCDKLWLEEIFFEKFIEKTYDQEIIDDMMGDDNYLTIQVKLREQYYEHIYSRFSSLLTYIGMRVRSHV